ncbi:MAG: hypothetical protein FJY95_16375 [Candidatus Handelsmanbacteria bacterium]|nr:hypothetical protein [Candidatus Handelsmanbacteria bacterium]
MWQGQGHVWPQEDLALHPGWVRDMADTYAELTIQLMEILFAKEGNPDGIWSYEDMGFKMRPFMSPSSMPGADQAGPHLHHRLRPFPGPAGDHAVLRLH